MPAVDIETYETKYAEGNWSDNRLAKATGLVRATFGNIRARERASLETLERVAKVFGCTADCLIDHGDRIVAPRSMVFDNLKEEYKTLLRSVLHSEDFAIHSESNGGLFNANFLAFVYQFKQPHLDSLDLSPNKRCDVHEELCRDGLLEKRPTRTSDGCDRNVYYCRLWSHEQCEDNMELRIGIEKLAIERVIRLLGRNKRKYDLIRAELEHYLDAFSKLIPSLTKSVDEKLAMISLKADSKFHKAWAGDAPDYKAAMSRAVFGHGQLLHRYISQMRIASSRPNPPKDMPTLASLALSSHGDLSEIYEAFIAIKTPDDKLLIDHLLKLTDQHPRNNWNRMVEIEKLNRNRD